MNMEILLNEEDYLTAIADLYAFADKYEIEYDDSSWRLLEIAVTIIMSVDLQPEELVMMTKLIYNIGYRDNRFKNSIIH